MAEKKFNVPSNILYYSFDLVGWGSADIARFIMGDFIPHFPQSTSQGSNTPGPQVVRVPLVRIPLMRIIKMSAFV